ncbi:MAG: Sec-dependent nitrous-oxide reductase [Kineosporiaceae bacterium]|nr:Sec-dependent nitrous-oxide reductase [Aeromicrobium sp.]
MKKLAIERRDFLKVGGGIVAGAAVGAVGSHMGSGTDLTALASSQGLSGDEASAALQTVVPPGKYDPYYMFASGGHSGQVQIIGVPSMRLLKIIPVFSRDSFSGYGFDGDVDGVIRAGSDPAKSAPLDWGDTHHPALSETAGQYDGRWLYINDRANGRIGMIDLADFKTKQIFDVPNIGSSHGGVFVTPNTEYAHISSITPRPITDNGYAPLERYADLYRGFSTWCFVDRKTGRLVPEKSFQIELPPYNQDLADMGKLASDGFGFLNSFNTELALGQSDKTKDPPIESGASKKNYDYLHVIDWKKAEKVVAAGNFVMRNGMRVVALSVAVSEGILHLVPEPKSPHGVAVSPDGKYIVISGKLDPFVTVFSIEKIKDAIAKRRYQGKDRYGVPIISLDAAVAARVKLGAGPLHTQYDGKGNAYTSLFIDSAVVKWTLGSDSGTTDKPFTVLEKIPVHYNIGHLAIPGGDTVKPEGKYVVALNKWSLDQVQKLGPQHPVNLELIDIDSTPARTLSSLPLGGSEPHYAQIINIDKLNPLKVYAPGTDPATMAKSQYATVAGKERIKRNGRVVDVYATLMRSHFTPEQIPVTVGDTVRLHVTNIESTENATHTLAVPAHNIQVTLDPGEVVNVEFKADRVGSFAFYCAQFCSALHMEMYGWLLVAPKEA